MSAALARCRRRESAARGRTAAGGRFYVDLRLAHPHGARRSVTFSALAPGVDQGPHTLNDARDLTFG